MRLILSLFLLLFGILVPAGESRAERASIGIEEKLGQVVAADSFFTDDKGARVNLKDRIDKPTIVAPVYFGCAHACPMLLTGLSQVLGRIDLLKPGKDFQVITLSFDENDTPAGAADKKKNFLKAIGRPFPETAWRFLTGRETDIRKFTDSIGFRFQRDGDHDFSHPVALVVLAPGGKIVRYVEGATFLPFEITLALTEASEGKVGSPARRALMYCFSYDPLKKSYVFNVLKVTGTVMILFVAGFLVYLLRSGKKQKQE